MDRSPLRLLAWALLLLAAAAPAPAHQFAPALLEIEERSADEAAVRWKQPAVRVQGSQLRPVLPVECEGLGDPQVQKEGTGVRARWRMRRPSRRVMRRSTSAWLPAMPSTPTALPARPPGQRIRQRARIPEPSFCTSGSPMPSHSTGNTGRSWLPCTRTAGCFHPTWASSAASSSISSRAGANWWACAGAAAARTPRTPRAVRRAGTRRPSGDRPVTKRFPARRSRTRRATRAAAA